jgi:hypothetical protein
MIHLNKNAPIRNLIINVILTIVTFSILISVCELVLRVSSLSDRLGWNRVPALSRRTEKFNLNAKIKIVCLGDSFVAWRAGEGKNMFDYLQKDLSHKDCAILNLGRPGVDIDRYIAIYKKYMRFKPDLVIMCVFLGNDIRSYASYPSLDEIRLYDFDSIPGQKWVVFLKRHSILANLIFRFAKERIPFLRSHIFERSIKEMQQDAGFSDDFIQTRIKQIDPRILELAKSDAINPWTPAMGIMFPDYYKTLFTLSSPDSLNAARRTVDIIREFYKKEVSNDFLVVFFPESLQVSEERDNFFKKCGFNLDGFPLEERRKIIRYLEARLNASGIKTIDTTFALQKERDIYFNLDTHLNGKGHRVVGEFIADFIKNHFLYPGRNAASSSNDVPQ